MAEYKELERYLGALKWIIPTPEQAEKLARRAGSFEDFWARQDAIDRLLAEQSEKTKRSAESKASRTGYWQIMTRAGGLLAFLTSLAFGIKGAGWWPW